MNKPKGCHENLIGQRFNRLTVIAHIDKDKRKTKNAAWLCKCDCGNTIATEGFKLKRGYTKSCGCMKAERVENLNKKYTITNKRLYGVYKAMVNRCSNPNDPAYHNYGGRGITVCDEWKGENGYEAFSHWAVQNGYVLNGKTLEHTLDRRDNSRGYSPDNCKWVTMQEQQNNKRTCRYFNYGGETHSIADWARILGLKYDFLHDKLTKQNVSLREVIDKNVKFNLAL